MSTSNTYDERGVRTLKHSESISQADLNYYEMHHQFRKGCYDTNLDGVETRYIDGCLTVVALIERSTEYRNRENVIKHKKGFALELLRVMAKKQECKAYVVFHDFESQHFWVYNVLTGQPLSPKFTSMSRKRYQAFVEAL
jgi:hypothetical protein